MLAGANLVCAMGIVFIGSPSATYHSDKNAPSGLKVLRETPYLKNLALLVTLGALAGAGLDYVFKSAAQANVSSVGGLITFFALFYTGTGLLSFVLQTTVASRLLKWVGLTGVVSMRPGVFIGGSVLALAFPGLWPITLFGASSQIVENSFYRSGYEILYTPLPKEKKRPTKTMIDVGFEKVGMAIGSAFVFVVLATVPHIADRMILAFTLATGILGFYVCSRLHKGYVQALADSLRSGAIALEDNDVVDKTTMLTLSHTVVGSDHEELIRGIAALRSKQKLHQENMGLDMSIKAIQDLRSSDSTRVNDALSAFDGADPVLTGHVIALLGDDRHVESVVETLEPVVERCIGQLVDVLLDTSFEEPLRRRIPRLIAMSDSQRAVRGLSAGLGDLVFNIRYRSCLALNKILMKNTELSVDADQLFAFVKSETEMADRVTITKRLDHIKNLLSLVTDREATQIGFRALQSKNANMKGTGKEYLKNIVSNELYLALLPLFEEALDESN